MITMSIFWALVFALFATKVQQPNKYQKKSRKWFRARRRWHDPMLVLNMSVFNSDSGGFSNQFRGARASGSKQ
jgi:hypothetical protein